jgi:hypothetical protein
MKALAGPAMLLLITAGFLISRGCSDEESPSREFADLELAGADEAHTGSCYALSTVLVANGIFGNTARTWSSPRENAWTLGLENVEQGSNGPIHVFQKYTFEQVGEQVRLVDVDVSEGRPDDLKENLDWLLRPPNARESTPVERCSQPGADKYEPPRR